MTGSTTAHQPPPGQLAPQRRLGRLERAIDRLVHSVHPGAWPIVVGGIGLAAATLVHFVDPHEPGNYPTCPWLMLTGTFCPGCGTMRAVNALTNLDIMGALQMNVVTVALIPVLGFAYLKWLYHSFRPRRTPARMLHPFWLWAFLGTILTFWLVRNLPFASFLAPG